MPCCLILACIQIPATDARSIHALPCNILPELKFAALCSRHGDNFRPCYQEILSMPSATPPMLSRNLAYIIRQLWPCSAVLSSSKSRRHYCMASIPAECAHSHICAIYAHPLATFAITAHPYQHSALCQCINMKQGRSKLQQTRG
ncbi:hypothetical protein Fot_01700 [Forsythia ovata]|uniref:Secreted protein n=1 Tax=Forsythia ovata TaxID=205694 RepID=A0ABD1X8I9_9LAMI